MMIKSVLFVLFLLCALVFLTTDCLKPTAPKKHHLIVTTILDSAYLSLKESHTTFDGKQRLKFEGFLKGFTDLLADKIGFTYEMRLVKDSAFGHMQEDSSWNGMIGEVLRREADVAISSMTINSLRAKYIDFSTAFIQLRLGVLMQKPDPEFDRFVAKPTGQFLFLRPMTWELWISFLIGTLASVSIIFGLDWIIHNQTTKFRTSSDDSHDKVDFQFLVFGPRSITGKFLGTCLAICMTIVLSAYISNFYNIRQFGYHHQTKISYGVKKIEDLISRHHDIKFSVIEHGSTANYIEKSPNPSLRRIYGRIRQDNTFVKSVEDGVDLVTSEGNGTYAFIMEELTAKYISSHLCNTFVATRPFGPKIGFGVVLRPNSSLLQPINLAITEMKETDILSALEREWLLERGKCHETKDPIRKARKIGRKKPKSYQPVQLDMENSAGLFYIWITLLIFSGIAAGLEIWIQTRRIKTDSISKASTTEQPPMSSSRPGQLELIEMPETPL